MKAAPRRRAALFLTALPAFLLIAAGGQRLLGERRRSSLDEDREASAKARTLVLRRLQREIEGDALTHAQGFVRERLVPQKTARIEALSVVHLKPHRYRVRATVAWRKPDGASVKRRVEADLQHGPMDGNWYLVDTEFLSAER